MAPDDAATDWLASTAEGPERRRPARIAAVDFVKRLAARAFDRQAPRADAAHKNSRRHRCGTGKNWASRKRSVRSAYFIFQPLRYIARKIGTRHSILSSATSRTTGTSLVFVSSKEA